ncbi:MAG: N-acetyltransferase [Myxococcaceae bacterium]|nr:N-acetyltransferase [Myxococcaceae bacterium]
MSDVDAEAWDGLGGAKSIPFIQWSWIHALEASGSASEETGWAPAHLTLWRGRKLVAAAPAYRKFHSMGEYIYDFGWANAAQELGIMYYPKLLVGVPLSPATAPRFLTAEGEDRAALVDALVRAAIEYAREEGCSGVHILYPPEEDARAIAERHDFAHRLTEQYHWRNAGYRTWDDFLARFTSKRRHQLKRERAAAAGQGISLRTVRGAELGPEHAERAWRFYEATNLRHPWGHLQLRRDFFHRVFRALPDQVELVEAVRGGKVIAGAFNLAHGDRLYGRYWGCFEEHPFLHFNVCMYHSIDECIRLGRTVFEPGAGGEHKIARGFVPTPVHSVHRIFDPQLDRAVRAFIRRERAALEQDFARGEEIAGLRPLPGR